MAALSPGQPGLPGPGRAGAPRDRSRLISWGLAVLAGLLALRAARDLGVVGRAAVPDLARAAAGAIALFAVCGFGITRLALPAALRRYEALWVLPVGACASALTMTVLGFAYVPFRVNLAVVLVAGVVLGAVAVRRRGVPAALRSRAGARGVLRRVAWPLWLAVLVAALALVPLFRAGFATVGGQGQDAHLAVGSAMFLQHHHPTAIAVEEPVDRMPLVWRSKQPIYYALAGASSLAGLEVIRTISTVAAVLLGLALLGFFLLGREVLRAPPWAALAGMALVGLDRMVLHTVMHPYYNQTWGFFALPFAFVLASALLRERSRGGVLLLAMFLAVLAFAYPLALPIALIPLGVLAWQEPRRLALRTRARALWKGPRSLLWMVPLGLVALVPVRGVLEKSASARIVIDPSQSLRNWGGDLLGWFPEPWFLGPRTWIGLLVVAPAIVWGVGLALRSLERPLRLGLLALLAFTAVFTVVFRVRDFGFYFHFKLLAFVAPVVLVLAAAGLAQVRTRWVAPAALGVMLALSLSNARTEIGRTFDQLPKAVLQLREVDAALPPGASVRLDVDPQQQNWVAFMLHGQPLCSLKPLLETSYPHVPVSRRADYILAPRSAARPRDAAGPPVMVLDAWTLWRASASIPGEDRCSQEMVQTIERITT